MRYTVNANTFMQLPYTTGTIQNVSNTDIEISNEQTIGTGIVLKAGETFAFNNATVYACARPVLNGGTGIISVVPFNGEGEGGESPIYVPKGSIAFALLPTTLNSTMLGWTYNVSDSFTTDSRFIEGAGVDYPAGENVVVVEPTTGTFKYDCFGGAYILPVANTTILGGVKSSAADGKVSVDNSGVMTINLPTASTAVKGGIKVGTGVEVDANQKLNVTAATSSIIGGVKSSNNEGKVLVNNDGTMTYNPLGYRQPSTAYTAGNIAYHSALPTGYYLECTTAGTTGSGTLTISTTTIGTTVSDGTVTWKITKSISTNGGTIAGDLSVSGYVKGTSTLIGTRLYDIGVGTGNNEYYINLAKGSLTLVDQASLQYLISNENNIGFAQKDLYIINFSTRGSVPHLVGYSLYKPSINDSNVPFKIYYYEENGEYYFGIKTTTYDYGAVVTPLYGTNNRTGFDTLYPIEMVPTTNPPSANLVYGDIYEILTTQGNQTIGNGLTVNGTITNNTYNLSDSAVVAKSIGTNGYIKYASGLIVQWGTINTHSPYLDVWSWEATYPISMPNNTLVILGSIGNENNVFPGLRVGGSNANYGYFLTPPDIVGVISWIAIGY